MPGHAREARRLIGRCAAGLARGGRLVVELPSGELAEAARAHFAAAGSSLAYRLRVARDGDVYEALVIGRDVAAWIAERPCPGGFELSLHPAHELLGGAVAEVRGPG